MSEPAVLTINIDGASRGNPGPAAFGYVIRQEGAAPVAGSGLLGRMTNNQAEYQAFLHALDHAARLGTHHRLDVLSDSLLLVNQVNGDWRVKEPDLRELWERASRLRDRFAAVTLRYVPREQNREADRLCNAALDGRDRIKTPVTAARSPKGAAGSLRLDAVRDQALACLQAAAAAWARGNPNDPPAAAVWEQLWSILEEEGVVRPSRQAPRQ